MKQRFAILASISLFGVLGTASASVLGSLNVANCANGAVTVTLTSIVWTPSAGANKGCVLADSGTDVTSATLPEFFGGSGTINNLPPAGGVVGFMQFPDAPGVLSFDLNAVGGFGPGSSTDCGSALLGTGIAINATCSVDASSNTPFVLLRTAANKTSISLLATGTITDPGDGHVSDWSGLYTTQFSDLNPGQIEDFLNGVSTATSTHCTDGPGGTPGSCTSTYSGSFSITITSVPEPSSMFLIGTGLLALATTLRKLKR